MPDGHCGPADPVRAGLDVVAAGHGPDLGGKRIGLVAHGASVTRDGRHAIDVLREAGVKVVRIFAPEHGLRGQAAAGETVDSHVDTSGIPVVSLYGAKGAPEAADLAGLDALLIDVQDVGVRFYTYLATMGLVLEAAGRASLPCVLLDRPNPLGGARMEGPLPDGVVKRSLLNRLPGPLVHGLTAGEMARLLASDLKPAPALAVVKNEGWSRSMLWSGTGRPWVPPSPNLRTAEAAAAYPGTCLLEVTNVCEGRGTDAPFLMIGAPWVDADALAREVKAPGYAFEPIRFTPTASAASPSPKFRDVECRGVRVSVDDGLSASPYRLGVELLVWLRRRHAKELEWRDGGLALDRLTGTQALRKRLEAGLDPEAIVAADAKDLAQFARSRGPALLYS